MLAAKALQDKLRPMAAMALGCPEDAVRFEAEGVRDAAGHSVAYTGLTDEPVAVEARFENKKYTYSYGSLAAHVAVDPKTGQVDVLDIASTKDVGRKINPATLISG